MKNDLVEFWRRSKLSDPPFVHPDDSALLQEELAHPSNWADFDGYIHGERFSPDDKDLHLSLFPVPYAGDLKRAKIFILLLNPGFNYGDYWADENPEFRKRLKQNLYQRFDGSKRFPFMFLDLSSAGARGFNGGSENFEMLSVTLQK